MLSAPGEGHIIYFKDVDAPTDQTVPAITAAGTYAATASTSYTWQNVAVGTHTFSAELVNNDHKPLATPVVAKITVTVTPPPLPTSVTINLSARNSHFDIGVITVGAGAAVTINFTNYDPVSHNFALYENVYATTPIFYGTVIGGVASITYQFTAPSTPGNYFFCDAIHRSDMNGQFIVQ